VIYRIVLEAQFNAAMATVVRGVDQRKAIGILQREWYGERFAKADTPGGAGDHGIPEIGKEEKAFYNALTQMQRDAFDKVRASIKDMSARQWEAFSPFDVVDEPIEDWKRAAMMLLAPQAMRAYLVGQMLASEKMEHPTQRPLLPQDKSAIEFLEHHLFNEIHSSFEDLKGTLRTALINGVQEGLNPREVSSRLANELEDYETNWDRVAITETSRAESQGRLREYEDAGQDFVIGSTAHDSKVCENCKKLIEGVVKRVSDIIGQSNYGRKQADWMSVIPLHPLCRCVWLPYDGELKFRRVTEFVKAVSV
jgi:SPP1 gp7 family putative phage head morphogenesis protein